MSLGTGPDYYNGINRAEDEQIKLQEKVDAWWNDLDDNYKFELIEPYYSDRAHLMGLAEMWKGIDWSEKVSLWEEEQEGFHGVKA